MPITLPPISRRRFLAGSLGTGAAILTGCSHLGRGQRAVNVDRVALLSDTHVHYDPKHFHNGKVNPWLNFQKVNEQILEQPELPATGLISGDCVYLHGRSEDYATLVRAVAPLRQEGMRLHLALGNHDHRENFWQAWHADPLRQAAMEDRHVLLVRGPRVNWFLLDSLVKTNETPGELGPRQLEWLARALDANANKPALVVVHHDPDVREKVSGLKDTAALMQVILPRRQVKAYIYGHTHIWAHEEREGLHLLNLPPTAWVFDAKRPNGWVLASLRDGGASFQLHTLDPQHPQNRQTLDLEWR